MQATRRTASFVAALLLGGLVLAGCAPPPRPAWVGAAYAPAAPAPGRAGAADLGAIGALGRAMFFEPSLSASGRTACASCHDPRFAYGPPNALALQLAGADGFTPGLRAAPSLRYLQTVPPFTEHFFDNDGDDSIDAGPTGGHTWDGRSDSAHDQARLPLLSPAEMANASEADAVRRIAQGPLAERFRQLFGERVFDDPAAAFRAALMALEVFQQSPEDFYPYSSRYDAVLRGQARLSVQEARGLALFNDPAKGNCASCHLSEPTPDGAFPLFTDHGLIALGVPRLATLPPLGDGAAADLGLCGPLRSDLREHPEYCGLFRTPTLRNVALRQRFFHNGAVATLEEAIRFYALRETEPERVYPRDAEGRLRRYDDLPERYHANLNVDPPFDRHRGDPPALTDADVADIAAFLHTLTDADLLPR